VLVVGASRGIGLELVRQHLAVGDRVVATARSDAGLQALQALGAQAVRMDVATAAGCAALTWSVDGLAFDRIWHVAGVYGPRTQGLEPPTEAVFQEVMQANVLAVMRLLPQYLELLAPAGRIGVLSSRMGSIGLRTSPAGWLYRASKAAVNSLVKDASLVLGERGVVAVFHPGWVRTDMGGPQADLDVQTSADDLRCALEALEPTDSGGFFNHDGHRLDW
jgi:NAD(P)-dependent dehydrogenase (short-subunit alcohol dehydrogenase family)